MVLATGDRGLISDVLEPVVYSPGYLAAHGEERALRRRQLAALPDSWFKGLAGLLDSTSSVALAGELAAVACPTLVVAAELDGFIPIARTRALAEGIPGARFVLIEGVGHAVVVEQPALVAALSLDFLAGLGSRVGARPIDRTRRVTGEGGQVTSILAQSRHLRTEPLQ